MERPSVEQQVFSWQDWDELQPGDLTFYNVELIVPVGDFPVGTKFKEAQWIASESFVVFTDDQDQEFAYELNVSLGNKIERSGNHVFEECKCGHDHD